MARIIIIIISTLRGRIIIQFRDSNNHKKYLDVRYIYIYIFDFF